MDKIWDRKSFEVGGHWPLWWGWKKRMTTQNRQKSNAKIFLKIKKKKDSLFVVYFYKPKLYIFTWETIVAFMKNWSVLTFNEKGCQTVFKKHQNGHFPTSLSAIKYLSHFFLSLFLFSLSFLFQHFSIQWNPICTKHSMDLGNLYQLG